MKRMRNRTFIIAVLALTVGPGILIYGFTRTPLYGAIIKLLGTHTVLTIAIGLLAVLLAAALSSLVYGFVRDNETLRRRRRVRQGS